jgi:putative tricarboxylic transport membrane protein
MAILRGTGIGFGVGLIPGPAPVIATYASYMIEKRISKHPEEFGQGAIEGVAGPESANNAACQSAFIPLFVLGIPFAPPTAILLGALLIHGVTPAP